MALTKHDFLLMLQLTTIRGAILEVTFTLAHEIIDFMRFLLLATLKVTVFLKI